MCLCLWVPRTAGRRQSSPFYTGSQWWNSGHDALEQAGLFTLESPHQLSHIVLLSIYLIYVYQIIWLIRFSHTCIFSCLTHAFPVYLFAGSIDSRRSTVGHSQPISHQYWCIHNELSVCPFPRHSEPVVREETLLLMWTLTVFHWLLF